MIRNLKIKDLRHEMFVTILDSTPGAIDKISDIIYQITIDDGDIYYSAEGANWKIKIYSDLWSKNDDTVWIETTETIAKNRNFKISKIIDEDRRYHSKES
jgi:hypothetical protein